MLLLRLNQKLIKLPKGFKFYFQDINRAQYKNIDIYYTKLTPNTLNYNKTREVRNQLLTQGVYLEDRKS